MFLSDKDIIHNVIKLGKQLDEEQNRAFDLWTWLPSYKVAKKWHDDYADAVMPSVADVLLEASEVMHALHDKKDMQLPACPCGSAHEGGSYKDGVLTFT